MVENNRILIIDDMESIHEDFKKIICPEKSLSKEKLDAMQQAMFGTINKKTQAEYELVFASQGQEGVNIVLGSIQDKRPFALAFIDIQMPPGIDGIETIEKIWKFDREIQIVICTAYAKYTWQEIQNKFGQNDRLFVLKKPFDDIEILNLAANLTTKWNINQIINEIIHRQENTASVSSEKKTAGALEVSLKRMKENVKALKILNEKLNEQQKKSLI